MFTWTEEQDYQLRHPPNQIPVNTNLIKIQISHIAHGAERSDNDPLRVMFCDVNMTFPLANQILSYHSL